MTDAPAPASAAPAPAPAPLTVLVVDDDFFVAEVHRAQVDAQPELRALPAVGTVAEARRVVARERVDLVLLDLYLPDGRGLDLLRELDVDTFVLSAASDGETIRTALRRGALAYLIKPFAAELLVDRLRSWLRFRHVLDGGTDQEAVERAQRILHSGDARASSRSRSATEQAVLEAVVASSVEVSASEVADQVGVSRATAQRYLAQLSADGQLAMQLRYGATGRPEHRYQRR
ncbi:response regulator [Frigoribacterium sp. ACAM 257]|uniref:response regulator n=1 Tax=Frigoribacterium sp. ACAM 257 TaxID=2508998 RepID=UPI001CB95714|nr:response regulator [Frigoribacterium sp. ACAM 257]